MVHMLLESVKQHARAGGQTVRVCASSIARIKPPGCSAPVRAELEPLHCAALSCCPILLGPAPGEGRPDVRTAPPVVTALQCYPITKHLTESHPLLSHRPAPPLLPQPSNIHSLAQQNTALLQAAFAPSLVGGLPPGPGPDGEQSPPPGCGPHRPGQVQGMPGGLRGVGGMSPPLASHRGHSSSRGPLSAPPLGSSGAAGPGLLASVAVAGGSYAAGSGGDGGGSGGSWLGNGAGGGYGGALGHMPQGGTIVGSRGGGSGTGPAAAGVAAAAFAAPPPLTIPESPSDGGSGGGLDPPGQGQEGWEGWGAAGDGGKGPTGPSVGGGGV